MQWLPQGWIPKAIAVDIDGTLTDSNKEIYLEAIEALRRLEDAGIPIILATGNVRAITYGLWRFIGATGPMVCENGGVVWHPDWDEPIVRADGSRARKAGQMLEDKLGIDSRGITTNAWRESEWCLFPDENLENVAELISKSEFSDLSVVKTGFAIHLMEPHLSKGNGLEILFKHMGWSLEDMLCVGDAPNDLSMFEKAGWSIAVKGAFDSVMQAADVCSPHLHGDTFEPLVEAILQAHNG